MGAVQLKMNLRIIGEWRTFLRDAADVLPRVHSIRLVAFERTEIWVEQDEYRWRQRHLPDEERNIIWGKAREVLLKIWQETWDLPKDGRWTHMFIPKIKE